MKRIILFCLISLVGLYLIPYDHFGVSCHLFAEAPKMIKFATIAPEGSTWTNVLRDIDKEIDEKSRGELRLKIYSGGVQGDEKDVIRKMRIGQLHSAGFTGVGLGEILPEVRIFDLPFFFKEYGEIDFVKNKLNERFAKAFEERGYVLLGWTEVGFVYFLSNVQINSLSNLRLTKMWMWEGDPLAKALFDSINLSPIPLSIVDVMTSLQTGLIDSVYASPLAAIALQWFTRVRYMLEMPMADAISAILITKKYYDTLPADLQKILKDTFAYHLPRLTQLTRKDNKESIEIMRDAGVKIITLNDEASIKEFEEASIKARESLVGNLFTSELLKEVTAELESYRLDKRNK